MATTTLPDSNVERIRWAFGVLNTHDVSELKQFWTDQTQQRFPDKTVSGADAIAAYFQSIFDAIPDFHMEVVKVLGDEHDVFVHWHLTGHHSGAPFQGIAATGKAIDLEGVDHFEITAEDTVARNSIFFDQMRFARQIGFVPEDGTPPDRAMKAAFNAKTRLAAKLRARRG